MVKAHHDHPSFTGHVDGFQIICVACMAIKQEQYLVLDSWMNCVDKMLQPFAEYFAVHPTAFLAGIVSGGA